MKVSIIVPVYNVAEYLPTCLDSLLKQDYENYEIILIDDGSTDESAFLCDSYEKKFEKIKVYHKTNGGLSSARNYGIGRAKGEYALFVDSDDTLEPQALSICMSKAQKINSEACLVFTYSLMSADGTAKTTDIEGYSFPDDTDVSGDKALEYLLTDRFQNFAWRVVFPVSIWREKEIAFPEGRLFEDVLTIYKLFFYVDKVYFINKRLYNYRQRSGSILHTINKKMALQCKDAFMEQLLDIKQQRPALASLCDSQIYKSNYRVAMLINGKCSMDPDLALLRKELVRNLCMPYPNAKTLQLFNNKQRVSLTLLKLKLYPLLNFLINLRGR